MKIGIRRKLSLIGLLVAGTFPLHAEDIDLYVSGSPTQNAPNVLMVLDNTSNWSAAGWRRNTQGGTTGAYEACGSDTICQGYVDQIFGTSPSSTLKQGQVEAAAIKLVLNELVCNATPPLDVNLGLEVFAPDKGANGVAAVQSGYIRRAVKKLDSTTCPDFIADLEAIIANINAPAFKGASSASTGELFFEAFKYFGGYTDPTRAINNSPNVVDDGKGTPINRDHFGPERYTDHIQYADPAAFVNGDTTAGIYLSPIASNNSCGKNYIVFLGNAWPNADNASLLSGLNNFSTTPIAGADNSGNRLGDVWAKFLATTDVSSVLLQQPVFTYAVNVFEPGAVQNSNWTKQRNLLQSIPVQGGTGAGGYYEVNGNLRTLIDGFKDIFLSIAAKNSVFASASLPVSVNTQGTYLNQVFIGMFRPDADAYQRWAGNLKQYKFAQDSNKNLYLADAKDQAVIDNANTGFIRQCTVSFWTSDTSNWPVIGTPYWMRVPVSQTPENGCKTPLSDGVSSTFSAFSDWPDGDIVEKGGAGLWLRKQVCGSSSSPTYCGRVIKSCADNTCSSLVDFASGSGAIPTGSLSATLVNWAAGGNLGDGPPSTTSSGTLYQFYNGAVQTPPTDGLSSGQAYARPTVHGDVVHSRPLAINYSSGTTDDIVVFYGANDGMLRGVDGNRSTSGAGHELWAFVAPEFFSKFNRLRENKPKIKYPTITDTSATPRDYFFDGAIGAYQERATNGTLSKVWLYPSMRRGGRMIYAFDATTRPDGTSANSPTLKWKFGCPNATDDIGCIDKDGGTSHVAKIGQTWSTPRAIRLKMSDNTVNTYVVFGGGHDKCEDVDNQVTGTGACGSSTKGQGVFVLNADTGQEVAYIDLTAITDSSGAAITAGRVISDVVPVDTNLDGYIDVIYVGDTRGNLWRITTGNLSTNVGWIPSSWVTKRVAYLSDWSSVASGRKIMYSPDVVPLGSVNLVLLGTGDREHPLGSSQAATVKNRFYGIYDSYAQTPTDINGNDCDVPNNNTLTTGCPLLDVTDTLQDYSLALASSKGWVLRLVSENSTTKEQVVTTPVTTGGITYFSTFQPTDTTVANQTCSNLGTARGYTVNFLTGGLVPGDLSRAGVFKGGGFPPSPVSGVVQLDDGTLVPFVLGGKGNSALEAAKVPVSIPATRKQVYRYQKIDTK